MAINKNHRGVDHPISSDSALSGDTRHPLHHMPLPKQEHPFKAHQNSIPNGEDPNMLRHDKGVGTGMQDDPNC
jgi:hypothetical protein